MSPYLLWGDRRIDGSPQPERPSGLRVARRGWGSEHDLSALTLETASDTEVLEDGYQLVGSDRRIDVAARQRSFEFDSARGGRLTLHVRVTDDAIGLRYRWDGDDDRLLADLTSFRFVSTGRAWIQPHDPPALGAPPTDRARARHLQ